MITLAVIANGPTGPAAAGPVADHDLFADLLAAHVREGRVDYAGFKADEAVLDRYLKTLAEADPQSLPRNAQFAFYINAYNAWTVKLILGGWPGVKSIKDLGSWFQSPWKKEIVHVGGRTISLDEVEHGILRPRFSDPRVHFAINCAAKSCPPLASEPYRAETLDAQLTRVTRAFLNRPGSYRLEPGRLWVNSIFKWFAEDFDHDPVGFTLKYAEGELKQRLAAERDRIAVGYLDYDWSLNGT
jgi:hypothetical protein